VVPAGGATRVGGDKHDGNRQGDWDVDVVGVEDPGRKKGAASTMVECARLDLRRFTGGRSINGAVIGDESPPQRSALELSGRQAAIAEILARKSAIWLGFYLGALHARQRSDDPDAIPQACHSIRELMEKLPEQFEVPEGAQSSLALISNQIAPVKVAWLEEKESRDPDGNTFSSKFLAVLLPFLNGLLESAGRKAELARRAVRAFAELRLPLPQTIQEQRMKEWRDLDTWFTTASHHLRSDCTPERFDEKLERLERLILKIAQPQVFERADILDEIIQEGEFDAQA